jgi:hypothetical protein
VFTSLHQHLRGKCSFPSVDRCGERQIQRNVEEDENTIDMAQRSQRTFTRRISAHLSVPRVSVWRTLHTEVMYPYHIQLIQYLEPTEMCNQLELCRWINYNPHMIRKVLFTDDDHSTQQNKKLAFTGS